MHANWCVWNIMYQSKYAALAWEFFLYIPHFNSFFAHIAYSLPRTYSGVVSYWVLWRPCTSCIGVHALMAHSWKDLFKSFRWKIWPRNSLRRPRFSIIGEELFCIGMHFFCVLAISLVRGSTENAGPEKGGPKRERVETEKPQSLI